MNKLYGTNPTLILDRLSQLALIPGKAPAPIRQPGGEQEKSSGQSGGEQNSGQQASHQPSETPDNNINKHHGRGERGDGDGDHPGPSRNIKCAQCGVNPRVEPKLYCWDCLEQQKAAKRPIQKKGNKGLNEALKKTIIFGDVGALLQADELIEKGATLELSFIIEKLSQFIDPEPEPEMSIWSTLTSMFFQILGYEPVKPVKPVKERDRVKTIEPWVDLWIESNFIDIESEEWNELILTGLKAEYKDLIEDEIDTYPRIWLKWLSKKFSQPFLDNEFVNAVKERKYWNAISLKNNGAKVNQTDIDAELEKAVADNDAERTENLHSLGSTRYEPALTLLLKDLCYKNLYSYSIANDYLAQGAVVTTEIMKIMIRMVERTENKDNLLKMLINQAQPEVLTAGLDYAFSLNKTEAIEVLIKLGGSTITSLITPELMQGTNYSYSAYVSILKRNLKSDASLSRDITKAGLQNAILSGDSNDAQFWIKHGASAEVYQLTKGLEAAAERGNFKNAKEWVELGAELSKKITNKGLKAVARRGNFKHAKEWVELGAELSKKIISNGLDAAIKAIDIESARSWRKLKLSPEQSQ
ncbi:hypothetical protein [Endozoicomonas euniceicola]|uniref:Ankyrin repeat protein n=1 Tax=Endozoicomonas euniceicola TaxID=1234143 RepID=A0ABY6GZ10_9GAMM|nr:hypothetical protein [Endozoicomonas euniceicola]UYM17619.1 hypothetical protein NX720_06855 [Endozoicomonas euniceicola]